MGLRRALWRIKSIIALRTVDATPRTSKFTHSSLMTILHKATGLAASMGCKCRKSAM